MAVLWPVTHHCPHQQDLTNFFKTRTGQHLDELTDLNVLDCRVVVDSVPELDEAVDLSPPTVGVEEDVEGSVPELNNRGDYSNMDLIVFPPPFWVFYIFFPDFF